MLSSSLRDNGKGQFEGNKISEFTVSTISSEVSVGLLKGGIRWRDRFMAVLTIPLLLLWSSSVKISEVLNELDLTIIDVVIDAVAVSVASNALLFRRFFVRVEWKVSLVWSDG